MFSHDNVDLLIRTFIKKAFAHLQREPLKQTCEWLKSEIKAVIAVNGGYCPCVGPVLVLRHDESF